MSLSVRSICIRVRHLLGSRGQDVSNLRNPRIAALIDPALETMAYRVAKGEDYRSLQKDYSLTPTAGVIAGFTVDHLFDMARSTVKVAATGVPLMPLDSLYSLFNNPNLSNDQVYYAQDGPGLRFRATDGTFGTYATALTVTSNTIPVLTTLPQQHEGLLIQTLAGLIDAQTTEMRARELSEAGRA